MLVRRHQAVALRAALHGPSLKENLRLQSSLVHRLLCLFASAPAVVNTITPATPIAASACSMALVPQRVCAQPSIRVMYAIGMFEREAKRLYLVAAAPRPIASSTTAENAA